MRASIRISQNNSKSFFNFRNIEMFQFTGDIMYFIPFHSEDVR